MLITVRSAPWYCPTLEPLVDLQLQRFVKHLQKDRKLEKDNKDCSSVMAWITCKLSFALFQQAFVDSESFKFFAKSTPLHRRTMLSIQDLGTLSSVL